MSEKQVMISESSLHLFNKLLGQVSIPASAPDFDAQCVRISKAKVEIGNALAQLADPNAPSITIEPATEGTSEETQPEPPQEG